MPESISNTQLATVLQRGANLRRDVRKARIVVAEDDPGMLLVDVVFDGDRRLQREASADKCFDGRTCGEILDDWLGPAPGDSRLENSALHTARRQLLNQPPAEVFGMLKKHQLNPPTPPRSKFDWKQPGDQSELPEGVLPSASVPEQPSAGGKLTRQQMIDANMDAQARHEQYKRQGGRHPDDGANIAPH